MSLLTRDSGGGGGLRRGRFLMVVGVVRCLWFLSCLCPCLVSGRPLAASGLPCLCFWLCLWFLSCLCLCLCLCPALSCLCLCPASGCVWAVVGATGLLYGLLACFGVLGGVGRVLFARLAGLAVWFCRSVLRR